MRTMNKQNVIDISYNENENVNKKTTKKIINSFLDAVAEGLADNEKIVLSGFGTFYKKVIGEGKNRYYVVRFKPSGKFKKTLKK